MNAIIFILSYFLGIMTFASYEFFNINFVLAVILYVSIIQMYKNVRIDCLTIPLFLSTTSMMLYSLMMGKNNSIFVEYIVWIIFLFLVSRVIKKIKNTTKKEINKVEKYIVPIISQIAIFIISVMVWKEINVSYYIIVSFVIVFIFSKFINSLKSMIIFIVGQLIVIIPVMIYLEDFGVIKIIFYTVVVFINAIIAFKKNND